MTLIQHPVLQEHQTSTTSSSSQLRVCAELGIFPGNQNRGTVSLITHARLSGAHSPSQSVQSPQESQGCNFFPPKKASFSKVVASNHSKKPPSVSLRKVQQSELSRILIAELPTRDQHWDFSTQTPCEQPSAAPHAQKYFTKSCKRIFPKPAQPKRLWLDVLSSQTSSEVHQRFFKLSLSHPGRGDKAPRASLRLLPASVCWEGRR